ncbi:MAG: hypothetical protein ACM3UT_11155 [Chloroflexota bacterium]
MKTKIFLFISVVMLFCLACNNNKPLTDSDKQQITGEVKKVVAQILTAAEKADLDSVFTIFYDSPDNVILTPEGKAVSFKDWSASMKQFFSTIQSQKINTIAENYMIVDKTTVWYSNVSKSQVNFKDSSIVMQDPWSMYVLFKRIDNEWRGVAITEFGHEEITKPAPLPKDMDQLVLAQQMLGKWRCEFGDTVVTYDQQPFGKAQLVSVRTTVKGKTLSEQKQLWSLDRAHNSMNFQIADKSGMGMVATLKFNTPKTYTTIPIGNISNPAYAPFRMEGEFTDPDTYVEKLVIRNEAVRTYITKRVK